VIRETDRRAFLRRLAAAGLAMPGLPLAGCSFEERPGSSAEPPVEPADDTPPLHDQPILLPFGRDAVHVAAPMTELPMAYVSMARREVYVDYQFRGRSNWILDAHISVSTGVWRIPLAGDPPLRPIQPGDTLREFDELDIAEWDPEMVPAEGDFRIRRGRLRAARVDFDCVPMAADEGWYSAGPFDVLRCAYAPELDCREDFVEIGAGTRRPLRGCAEQGRPVRVLTWTGRAEA
jgi:hypothetical protein